MARRDWNTYRKEREKWIGPPPRKVPIDIIYEPERKKGSKSYIIATVGIVVILIIVVTWLLLSL